jgi:hypothetical protein
VYTRDVALQRRLRLRRVRSYIDDVHDLLTVEFRFSKRVAKRMLMVATTRVNSERMVEVRIDFDFSKKWLRRCLFWTRVGEPRRHK